MPILLKVHAGVLHENQVEQIFEWFVLVDKRYSPYRKDSEVSQLQHIPKSKRQYKPELAAIMELSSRAALTTNGYFNVEHNGIFDPSGIVKGWAIQKAAEMLDRWTKDFYIEAGGDIQVDGVAEHGKPWRIGIRNPFDRNENVSIVKLHNLAIATSGTAIRGNHIYDPVNNDPLTSIVSMSVIGENIIDADIMATASFAMGEQGIHFIEELAGYEAFTIDSNRLSTQTSGWSKYEVST